jgi:hypothetical protein
MSYESYPIYHSVIIDASIPIENGMHVPRLVVLLYMGYIGAIVPVFRIWQIIWTA